MEKQTKNSAYYLGFDDRWLRLVGTPVIALIIPPVFFSSLIASWPVFAHSLIYTAVTWEVNRLIFIQANKRFTDIRQWKKRLMWMIGCCVLFTAFSCTLIGVLISFLPEEWQHAGQPKSIASAYGASYVMLLAVGAVYESIRLFQLWRTTIFEKQQLERAHLASQLEGLRNQVNPHFLFNSLNTLVYLIPEDPGRAVRFVQQMSKVYRYVLESRETKMIPLREELEFLQAYVFLLKERFGENIQVDLHDLNGATESAIVPLSLQMLFENAIKHNVISTQKPLNIEVFAENGHLVVRNNLQRKNQVMDSTGVGLENIRARYRMLTEKAVDVIVSREYFTVLLPMVEAH